MKKLLVLFASFALVLSLAACGGTDEPTGLPDPNEGATEFEIALVTDVGTIDDGSFNEGAWTGVEKFAKENYISYKYYQPLEKTMDEYVKAIELAITNGARTVVCPGFLFENAVHKVQSLHPMVNFIILDGSPHNVTDWDTMATYDGEAPDFTVETNVRPIFYSEQQSGFLAGYAAVKDGFTKLGFIGGIAVPAVERFGYGFIQGADQAAQDMGMADDAITINYWYSNVFWEDPSVVSKATAWYTAGTEVIFAAAGGAGTSVMTSAFQNQAKVIGVDVDQRDEDGVVITSAKKELANSVFDTLYIIYGGVGTGGDKVTFDVNNDGVGLPQEFDRFTSFDQAAYDAIYAKLVDGTITVFGDDTKTVAEVAAMYNKANVVEE
jgi:basic membrane protein A